MATTLERDVVIVGSGHAGAMAGIALRQNGFSGSIQLIGEEDSYPYERPPLSKGFLTGELVESKLYLRNPDFWAAQRIELRQGLRVALLRRECQEAVLSDGSIVRYRWCVLATGGRPRALGCTGADLAGVHYLRSLLDVAAIRHKLFNEQSRIVVIGGGFVGLEVAASVRKMGHEVTVIEAAERVLKRVTSPIVSAFFEAQHVSHGVDLRCGESVTYIEGKDQVEAVHLASGEVICAGLIVAGVGLLPNQELAQASGLHCSNGIEVDSACRTADPAIFAIGDVAFHPNNFAGASVRLESVQNAVD